MNLKQQIAADLAEARQRTHELLAPVEDERLTTQHDMLMSPPVWDYAHIGLFSAYLARLPSTRSCSTPTTRSRHHAWHAAGASSWTAPALPRTWLTSGV